jgi:hypothetical protein
LVDSRKEGRWIFYALPGKDAPLAVRAAIEWVGNALADSPRAAEDAERLNKVLKLDPAILCKKQCRR